MDGVAVLLAQQQLRHDAVLDHRRAAPLAGDQHVLVEVPPGVVVEVLRPAVGLPGAQDIEGLVIEQRDPARPIVVALTAVQSVRARASTQLIEVGAADETVVAESSLEHVVVRGAVEEVVPGTTGEPSSLSLEERGVLDVTRERNPPHYHVAVFPKQYQSYAETAKAAGLAQILGIDAALDRLPWTLSGGVQHPLSPKLAGEDLSGVRIGYIELTANPRIAADVRANTRAALAAWQAHWRDSYNLPGD